MKTLYGRGRDWPIFYDDLEPWYAEAEREIGVNGRDTEDQSGRNDGAFPPRSAPYPMIAQPFSSMNEKAKDILDSAGYPTIHEPNARASSDYDGRPTCIGSNNCMPICPVGAQYSGERHADNAGVKLITSAIVYKIELAGDKTVAALHYKTPTGESHRLTARRYVLAGHAIETPRLLLMSATDGAPDGVANSSGMVGRNLMNHPPTSITMVAKDELWPGRGPVQQNAVIPRRDGEFRSDRAASRHQVRNEAPNYAVTKGLLDEGVIGPSLDKQIAYRSARWLTISTVYEQLPDPNNRITLSTDRKDALGLPSPDIFYDIDGYTQKAADEVFNQDYKDFVRLFGGEMVSVSKEWGVQAHIMGTMIMGAKAEDSVVDGFCRTHDHHNLFIASTGVMTTASVVNPTLTGAALALRMAETIAKEV